MADVSRDRLGTAVEALRALGLDVEGIAIDVTDPPALERLADRAFTAGHVAVVCLNAGVPGPLGERAWEIPFPEWEAVIDVNMWGPVRGSAIFIGRLLGQGGESHVLFTISQGGLFTNPVSPPYFASKHAVYALANILHDQLLKTLVHVSAICPGATQTPLLETIRQDMQQAAARGTLPADDRVDPRRRTLTPSQVADSVLDAIGTSRFHVLMNPEYRHFYEEHVGRVLGEWPEVPPTGSVRIAVERLLAGVKAAEPNEVRACFRSNTGRGDVEPAGLGRASLSDIPSLARRVQILSDISDLDGGRVAVRWTARSRVTGEVLAEGIDTFAGDADAIWTADSTCPIEDSKLAGQV